MAEPAEQTFELRARPPVRALAISSIAAVAGAVVLVLAGHPVVFAIGVVLLAFSVLLAAAALVLAARLRSTVRLSADGLSVTGGPAVGGRRQQSLAWTEIAKVESHGHRLVALATEGGPDLTITVPDTRTPTYARLVDSLRVRLDTSRGYRNQV
jgi:hypothetical protein